MEKNLSAAADEGCSLPPLGYISFWSS